MLDVPELDDLICQKLNRRDLAHCSRVNKQWHRSVAPYLWSDISNIHGIKHKAAFRSIVLEDYLQEYQQQQQQQQQNQTDTQSNSMSTTTLSKYSHWIQKIPPPNDLYSYFVTLPEAPITRPQQLPENHVEEPVTTIKLMRHFLIRCSNIVVHYLHLSHRIIRFTDLMDITIAFYLPHVYHLDLSQVLLTTPIDFSMVDFLLSQCCSQLRILTLDGRLSLTSDENSKELERQEEEASPSDVQLKELIILQYPDYASYKKFWSWLWRRCGAVERLDIGRTSGNVENLTKGMLTHMPKLCKIRIGTNYDNKFNPTDSEISALLSGCRNDDGWKEVEIDHSAEFLDASKSTLVKHYSTLQVLIISCVHFTSKDTVLLLSTATKLQVFKINYDGEYESWRKLHIEPDIFIDQDPDTGLLRPWACESSLKILKVKVRCIPRLDLGKRNGVLEETYPGQGQEIQSRVYERLGRFSKLQELCLGYGPSQISENQLDCLEMSLGSGLDRLIGLKELRDLNLSNMRTRIGLKEVKWMAENWPKLSIIHLDKPEVGGDGGVYYDYKKEGEERKIEEEIIEDGVSQEDEEKELSIIFSWLREHYPRIKLYITD